MPTKPKISAKEFLAEIQSGMTDAQLMEKYQVSRQALQKLFSQLVTKGFITQTEIDQRKSQEEPVSDNEEIPVFTCPKCGKQQSPGGESCLACGVIFSKLPPPPPKEPQDKVEPEAADESQAAATTHIPAPDKKSSKRKFILLGIALLAIALVVVLVIGRNGKVGKATDSGVRGLKATDSGVRGLCGYGFTLDKSQDTKHLEADVEEYIKNNVIYTGPYYRVHEKPKNVIIVKAKKGFLTKKTQESINPKAVYCFLVVAEYNERNRAILNFMAWETRSGAVKVAIPEKKGTFSFEPYKCPDALGDWDNICPFPCSEAKALDKAVTQYDIDKERRDFEKWAKEAASLQAKGTINERDAQGDTPLIRAARKGNTVEVVLLLKHGANIDDQNKEGNSALMEASKAGPLGVVEVLLERNARIDLVNRDSKTALDLAEEGGQEKIVKELKSPKKSDQ